MSGGLKGVGWLVGADVGGCVGEAVAWRVGVMVCVGALVGETAVIPTVVSLSAAGWQAVRVNRMLKRIRMMLVNLFMFVFQPLSLAQLETGFPPI